MKENAHWLKLSFIPNKVNFIILSAEAEKDDCSSGACLPLPLDYSRENEQG
ncbi:hypothetical protein MM221_07570 [Salipaludibacillus sp. LMS25]|jgi:hypothetical protein|uniref:hypothetical protein n=1 Tax=Salipaludibacillus sp. LMS25 TaxID=2924031 RepID=UPI0020D12610|nr:hypothetical protein [Salipaludibacillus sp. LMS25]UTR16393.1 hypothetical protein MM221_07570 [Salipaludibacillus sp. LMS25]